MDVHLIQGYQIHIPVAPQLDLLVIDLQVASDTARGFIGRQPVTENACESGKLGSGFMRGRLRTDCDLEKVMRSRAVLGTSPPQSSNQETLWNISAKRIFALDVDFRFLLCKEERQFAHQWATAELRR